ncbi:MULTISPECIES: LysR family transcriptional regulator [Caballeronia]|uniref:LysR family transcriptional regulator n=1 Tax=Caballeronia TaxID=1827195 RepID=UPI00045EE4E0|nr:LysR family transcriptional regulator [Caballeronia sp. CLC5]MCE4574397.1 LysR family transcriptional regulator [Caballeronia sp. CLC5]BAO89744.1 LysR family transcriptional regulator [Burkholderia sp. RPE67]BBP99781.1 transcriptional regulator [Burkholderia sp. SFA1]
MNEVRAISIFVRAAALGSLRRAAIDQGISPQAASHAVMQLENALGVRVFHRTTRKLSLTEEGQRLLQNVGPALEMLSSAIAEAKSAKEHIAGPLRVSAPRALRRALWPCVLEFAARYPDVALDVRFDDHFTDLVEERADVGFRGGSPPAAGAIARRLAPIQLVVCASPAYIDRYGAPRTVDDLAAHRCTGYRRANTGKEAPWEFMIGDEIVYREIAAALCANDIDAEADAVLAGLAIGQLGSFSAATPIREGRLVPLLTQHLTQRESIYLYYRHRTAQPLRVRTFIDFIVEKLADNRDFFLSAAELRAFSAA